MSKYIQRCRTCHVVRGLTSFRVPPEGGRVPVCKWCEEQAINMAKQQRKDLLALKSSRRDLETLLSKVNSRIRAIEKAFALPEPHRPAQMEKAS